MSGKGKLVRDKIPEIIEAGGRTPVKRVALKAEFLRLLAERLVEEAEEFAASGEVEKLADVLEVVRAICAAKGMGLEIVEEIRKKKLEERGGFEKRIVLEGVCGSA